MVLSAGCQLGRWESMMPGVIILSVMSTISASAGTPAGAESNTPVMRSFSTRTEPLRITRSPCVSLLNATAVPPLKSIDGALAVAQLAVMADAYALLCFWFLVLLFFLFFLFVFFLCL